MFNFPFAFQLWLFAAFIKALWFFSYRSTDFEVHRNWLAITYSLPLKLWYYENTSEWTLDYPPFFAHFEHLLSYIAALIDPKIVEINNLNYDASSVIVFQRLSVVIADLSFLYGTIRCVNAFYENFHHRRMMYCVIFLIPGCLLVDHVHFQYNGLLLGGLMWSLAEIKENNILLGAAIYAVILNFKHIFLYLAPAYFVFLLRHYCFSERGVSKSLRFETRKFLSLGMPTLFIFVVSFGPFVRSLADVSQIMGRLFPFKRGLNHSYWAANIWAIYSAADRTLVQALKILDSGYVASKVLPTTRGLVDVGSIGCFGVLPDITPRLTMLLTFAAIAFPVYRLCWRSHHYVSPADSLLKSVVLCGLFSFLFGWHVHEKAILMALVPMSVLAGLNPNYAQIYIVLSVAGQFALFPLLHRTDETIPIKILLLALHTTLSVGIIDFVLRSHVKTPPFQDTQVKSKSTQKCIQSTPELIYLIGFLPVQCIVLLIPALISSLGMNAQRWEFMPLMLTSVYCAIGVIYSSISLTMQFLK